jgi:hypothetical protein
LQEDGGFGEAEREVVDDEGAPEGFEGGGHVVGIEVGDVQA